MRTLPIPVDTQASVFALCIADVADSGLQARLTATSAVLAASGKNYEAHAIAQSLHLIPRLSSVGTVSKEELKALYGNHLSSETGAARDVYDRIRNSSPNKRCPLCGVGTVAQVDHHLPKSRYPDLAVLLVNLVPICHFCNDTKKAKYPKVAGEQTFHPYYDTHLTSAPWVRATINHGPPPVMVFDTNPPATWTQTDKDRVIRHFAVCGLSTTFTSNANDELPVIRDRLKLQASRGGQSAVQSFLNDECLVHASRQNSWQYAVYRALAADSWFVIGGYLTVP